MFVREELKGLLAKLESIGVTSNESGCTFKISEVFERGDESWLPTLRYSVNRPYKD